MRLGAVHHLLAEGTEAGAAVELDVSVNAAAAKIGLRKATDPAAHIEALPFLLQTLRDDLAELAATAEGISGTGKMPRGVQPSPHPELVEG